MGGSSSKTGGQQRPVLPKDILRALQTNGDGNSTNSADSVPPDSQGPPASDANTPANGDTPPANDPPQLPVISPQYTDEGGVVAASIASTVAEIAEMDAELAYVRDHGNVSPTVLGIAKRELVLAIGITRISILNADKQLEVDAASLSSMPTLEGRKILLAKLQAQVALAEQWNLTFDDDAAVFEAALINDASTNSSSFADTISFCADEGVDQRLVFGYLALRESGSKVASAALVTTPTDSVAPAAKEDAGVAAVRQMNELLPSFNASRVKESESWLAAISNDTEAYDDALSKHAGTASPGVMDRLRDVAAYEPQMTFWEYRINHPLDPRLDSLEYVLVRRRRAADDSILLCQIICDVLASISTCPATLIPGGVKSVKRFIFKSVFKYVLKGCFSRIYDAARCTISVPSLDDAAVVAEAIKADPKLLMLREKLRLDPDSNVAAVGGYRDMQFLVAGERSHDTTGGPRHYVGEITINLADNLAIQQGADDSDRVTGHAAFFKASESAAFLPATDSFTGAASKVVASKIEAGTLHDVAIVNESTGISVPIQARLNSEDDDAPPLPEDAAVASALSSALASGGCKVQKLNLSKDSNLMGLVVPKLQAIQTLTHLTLSNYHGKTFPDSMGDMPELEHLDVSGCSELLTIPTTIGKLKKLVVLNMEACWHLETLPAEIGDLICLEILDLNGCGKLKMIPDSVGNLTQLVELKLERASKLLALPSTIGTCSNLKLLTISGKLTDLPKEIGELKMLSTFELTYCNDLVAVPATIEGCANLISLTLHGGFADIPASVGKLKLLESLTICGMQEELPSAIGHLPKLSMLNLANCYELIELPSEITQLSNLSVLNIRGCTQLDFQKLPVFGQNVEILRDEKKKSVRSSTKKKKGSTKKNTGSHHAGKTDGTDCAGGKSNGSQSEAK